METGTILEGRYQIIQQIGKGGGGIVYLAEHLTMKKKIVLKEIVNNLYGIDEGLLRTEVDILKRLKHPALPQVYDYLVFNNRVFTVMEYIPGCNLQKCMDNGCKFSQGQIVMWARQLAEVLQYMHSQPQPVIHRDIKPSNIMLKPDGNVCLIDFNISDDTSKKFSLSGYSRGFASPEQLKKGRREESRMPSSDIIIDERTDIYSLGAVLYYLLCRKIPEENKKTLTEENCCFQPLAIIVDKCLQKEKRKRYKTAEKLLYALNHLEKTDREYVKYVWYGRGALTISLFLVTIGICLISYGFTLNQKDEYYKTYNIYLTAVNNDTDDAESRGLNILNNRMWQKFLEENPKEKAEIFFQLGKYFYRKEQYENAMEYYEKAINTGEVSDKCYTKGVQSCIMSGDLNKANYILQKAEDIGIEECQILFIKGELFFADEKYEEALNYFDKVSTMSLDSEVKDEVTSRMAETYIVMNNYEKAKELLEGKVDKTYSDWMNLSYIFQKEKKWSDAGNILEKLQSLYPEKYMIYVRLALLEYEKESEKPQSLKNYEKMEEYYKTAEKLKKTEKSEEWDQLSEIINSLRVNGWI